MASRRSPQGPPPDRRRDRLIREREHDPYKSSGKLPDPTACPDCGALYRSGRWSWGAPPVDAHRTPCPACLRTRDDYPAGFLTLAGAFVREHREELIGLARNVEEREKGEHPLKRIMAIRDEGEGVLITTADSGLARNIGDGIHHAYGGDLDYQYAKEEDLLRVTWKR